MNASNIAPPAGAAQHPAEQAGAAMPDSPDAPLDALPDPHAGLINELRVAAQWSSSPLGAVVTSENAKLFAFAHKYQTLLDAGLAQAQTLDELKDLDFAVKRRLDLHRQCQMYGQLLVKLEKSERRDAPPE